MKLRDMKLGDRFRFVGSSAGLTGQRPTETKAMKRFEYRLIDCNAWNGESIEVLERMGKVGWELVSYSQPMQSPNQVGFWMVRMVFKRER